MATVSRSFERIGETFSDAVVDNRDWETVIALALVGSVGGMVATQVGNLSLDFAGFDNENRPFWGRIASGISKLLFGAVLVLGADRFGPMWAAVGAVAGIGAMVVAGGDFLVALLEVDLLDKLLPDGSNGGTSDGTSDGGGSISASIDGPQSAPTLDAGGSSEAPSPSGGGTTYR